MPNFESTIVYRCPGPHQRQGGTYDYRGADSKELFDTLLDAGWQLTLPDAIAYAEGKPKVDTVDEDAPPTREELELKAKELGIDFDGRTTDPKLLKRIKDALKG